MDTVTQENVVLSQTQPIVPEQQPNIPQPKQSNFLTILLSVLLFISVSIAGFFAYQTQVLVKELTSMKATSTPVLTNESITDSTADWKTYTGVNYTIKLPLTWQKDVKFQGSPQQTEEIRFISTRSTDKQDGGDFTGGLADIKVSVGSEMETGFFEIENETLRKVQVGGQTGELKSGYGGVAGSVFIMKTIVKYQNNVAHTITLSMQDDSLKEVFIKEYQQILSTYSFVDPSSPSVVGDKSEIEIAAKKAFVERIGQEPTTKYGLSDESLKVVDNWAFGVITTAPLGEGSGPGANYFIARKMNGIWDASMEYTNEFKEWLKLSPAELVDADLKKVLQ
jgi:hypothetical protein